MSRATQVEDLLRELAPQVLGALVRRYRDFPEVDDTLTLLLLCCHPSLTPVSQVALTLRAFGG